MAALASLDDLKARLDRTLDTDEERIAAAALEDASDLARGYGERDWPTANSAPRMVRTLVLRAAKRYMDNPEGYTVSRAGDETVQFSDHVGSENAGVVHFTDTEIRTIRAMAGNLPAFGSATVSAWGSDIRAYRHRNEGHVPVAGGAKPFPMFSDDQGPW